jgi:hypothetical protein
VDIRLGPLGEQAWKNLTEQSTMLAPIWVLDVANLVHDMLYGVVYSVGLEDLDIS